MRRLAAVLVLLVFASLNAMDGICCPDGCTHEEQPAPLQGSQARDGMCVLCAGGIDGPDAEMPGVVALVENRVAGVPLTPAADIPPEPLEHPPRS